jgi:hypothetical protein
MQDPFWCLRNQHLADVFVFNKDNRNRRLFSDVMPFREDPHSRRIGPIGMILPPFSQLIEAERHRWAPFKRALSKDDQAVFDKKLSEKG